MPFPTRATSCLSQSTFEEDWSRSLSRPNPKSTRRANCCLASLRLCSSDAAAAILLGFFLGGGRALYRVARGKPASSVYETEFISLNLREMIGSFLTAPTARPRSGNRSRKPVENKDENPEKTP